MFFNKSEVILGIINFLAVPKYILLLSFLLSSFLRGESQVFFRIKADFVMKVKTVSGQQQLTVGKVFYDKNQKQIVYDISFPEKEVWIQRDTVLYKLVASKVIGKQPIPGMIDFSIYSLVLNGNLADYGLKKTKFKISKVDKNENNVISTWEPPAELKKYFGDVLLSNVNQQLEGIVFKNSEGEVVSRQFFRNYIKVKGLSFPRELIKETDNDYPAYKVNLQEF